MAGSYCGTSRTRDKELTQEIIYLQARLSIEDWKKMRNVMFPDYYKTRLKLGGQSSAGLEYKLRCIKSYLKRKNTFDK